MLDIEFEQEAFESASESGRFAPSTSRLSQDEEDDLCMRLLPNLLGEPQTTFKHSQTFDAQYFVSLLKVVRQGISLYMEQRSFPEGYNQALLSIFKMKQPIIPFQVLHDLIKSFVKKIDEQLYFAPGDEASYIQAESITPENRVNIIGDIHGSIHSLVKIFEDSLKGKTGNTKYVFLGDYTDRGMFGAEVLALLICFKLANWNNVFMLRGNHECYAMNLDGGGTAQFLAFKTELEAKYGLENGNKLLLEFNELYKRLPLALYMKTNEEDCVQFCHAGFHPGFNPKEYLSQKQPIQGVRFTNGYNFGHFNGFVWGDFYQRNCKIVQDVSGRGIDPRCLPEIDNVMSSDPASKPIECTGIKAIFRGHQHFGCGFKMFPKTVEKSDEKYETTLGSLPVPWYMVVDSDQEGLSRDVDGRFKLKISHYIPIFTFSAATELGVTNETYYGVLQPAEKFEDWTLKPICLG
jgi:hypothetical protein